MFLGVYGLLQTSWLLGIEKASLRLIIDLVKGHFEIRSLIRFVIGLSQTIAGYVIIQPLVA